MAPGTYPDSYSGGSEASDVSSLTDAVTALSRVAYSGTTGSVGIGNTATITIDPTTATPFCLESLFLSNVIGKDVEIGVYVEMTDGEGPLASNLRDYKDYDGTETYGGFISNISAAKTMYITITNSSTDPITFAYNMVISGTVTVTSDSGAPPAAAILTLAWGLNDYGQLGEMTNDNASSPMVVAGSHSFSVVGAGWVHSLGMKSDGTAWAWGGNTLGQLGNLTIDSSSSPISVVGGHSFSSISAGGWFNIGLKSNGTAWTWGENQFGQLGNLEGGMLVSSSSPVSVVGGHSFVSVSAGGAFAMALKSDGTAWSWGNNLISQLGNLGGANESSPISVAGAHSFIKIFAKGANAMGLKNDGSTWIWGDNTSGQIGDLTTTTAASPTRVVGSHSFINIATGWANSVGLKVDGTVWTWGDNTSGQLGDGTGTSKSSPISVIGGHSFISIFTGGSHVFGMKSDGHLWVWGANDYGQLGDSSTSSKSSPISVIGGRSFIMVAGGNLHNVAIS